MLNIRFIAPRPSIHRAIIHSRVHMREQENIRFRYEARGMSAVRGAIEGVNGRSLGARNSVHTRHETDGKFADVE